MVEICAGDGSLAERLLDAGLSIASYTLLERNAELLSTAKTRLQRFPNVTAMQADATQRVASLGRAAQLVLSSGSVLCGQVGTSADAAAALSHVSFYLQEGGCLLATGFSTSFLHPNLIRRAGFEVVGGSLPSGTHRGAGPIESPPTHAFGRFQFFVLRKGDSTAGGKKRPCLLFDALAAVPEA